MSDFNEQLCKKNHDVIDREFGIIHKRIDDQEVERKGEIEKMCMEIATFKNDFLTHKTDDVEYKRSLEKGIINFQNKIILAMAGVIITLILAFITAIATGKVKII